MGAMQGPISTAVAAPGADDCAAYYAGYLAKAAARDHLDLLTQLERQPAELATLFARVKREQERFAYAPGKWTLRQIAGHLVDAERLFGFRAWHFSRSDAHPLPSFEENDHVAQSNYDAVPIAETLREFGEVRAANLTMLRRLTPAQWLARGTASGNPFSARAAAWILAGHPRHHAAVIAERYAAALSR